MSQNESSSFHLMNEPYISYNNRNIRKPYHTIAYQNNILPSYQSESLLKSSQLSGNENSYQKQIYSRSSTNLNLQSYELTDSEVKYVSRQTDNEREKEKLSLQYSLSQHNNRLQENGNGHSVASLSIGRNQNRSLGSNTKNDNNRSQVSLNNNQQQYQHTSQQQSTRILHQKIYYLEKQLQQLTRILQQQSKMSLQSGGGNSNHNNNIYYSNEYQQVAIQNAQLTIKVQELEEQLVFLQKEKTKTEKELLELGQEYERSHMVNNELREKLLELQQKINSLEKQSLSTISQIDTTTVQGNKNNINSSYIASLQRQNTRLNEEIQNLLTKLHNLNIEYNEEQSAKEELMQKMNDQLVEVEKLRKELSDSEVEKLQLQQMNSYLKQEIAQVNSLSANKLKQIQEKYIREDISKQRKYDEIEIFNKELQIKIKQLQAQMDQLIRSASEGKPTSTVSIKKSNIITPTKSEPFKDLFQGQQQQQNEQKMREQISLLNQQLNEEKQRHQLIKTQYTEMLQHQQSQINQLEQQVRKFSMENKTLKIQISDKQKQILQKQSQIDQVRMQCERLNIKINQNKQQSEYEMIKVNRNSEITQRQYENSQRERYQENMRMLNEENKRLMDEKQAQFKNYQLKVTRVENQLNEKNYELQKLRQQIYEKQQEIRQKDYLAQEMLQLQTTHQLMVEEVRSIKNSKNKLAEQLRILKEQNLTSNAEEEIRAIKKIVSEKQDEIAVLKNQLRKKDFFISQLNEEIAKLNESISRLNQEKGLMEVNKNPRMQKPIQQKPFQSGHTAHCPLCPEVLKQFHIYKELMELKFQTMNQMLDEMKISFIRAQFQMKDEMNKDKSKYEYWIQKYDTHDKEYKVLMERLWEWEKINAKNQIVKNDYNQIKIKQNGINGNTNKKQIISYINHTNNNSRSNQPAGHLSDLQYDLYLIKLENSTLRSQIANLEKELSQKSKNPQTQKQIQQLKKYSDNLLNQNEELKNRLTQIISQKKIPSSKDINFTLNPNQQQKPMSIFQRYSSQNYSKETIENTRSQERALASAELFINKLKKENDNLIEAKHMLQEQLDQEILRNQSLMKQLQIERQKYHREKQSRSQTLQKVQVLDRYNLPIQYIKYHPQHKKLQSQYVALKRVYLQMQLQYKKSKQSLEQNLQKLKIENEFHLSRITELQKNQQSTNLFSFNQKFIEINKNQGNYQDLFQKSKTMEQRCKYLENQLQIKQKQYQILLKKYESLVNNAATPRNKIQSKNKMDHLEVSPIQSPEWQQNSAQEQNSDRLFINGQISFDEKCIEKLKHSMDKKMLELEITPRQASNLIIKATWLIQRLATDVKQLRNNIEILKGQRKAIMKERNDLKEKLENIEEVSMSDRSKPFAKYKTNKTQSNNVLDDSINSGLNKLKISKGYQSVPKLNFDANSPTPRDQNMELNEKVFNDVIKQTLELKNQRRSGLKKFQQQVEKLTYN